MAPADEAECRNMLYTGYMHSGPASVRYPRGGGPGVIESSEMVALPIGKSELKRKSNTGSVVILSFGTMLQTVMTVADEIDATVVNMRFVKPLDTQVVQEFASRCDLLVTVEENVIMGGAGSAVNECLAEHRITVPVLNLGVPDEHIDHGTQAEQHAQIGLDVDGIRQQIETRLKPLGIQLENISVKAVS